MNLDEFARRDSMQRRDSLRRRNQDDTAIPPSEHHLRLVTKSQSQNDLTALSAQLGAVKDRNKEFNHDDIFHRSMHPEFMSRRKNSRSQADLGAFSAGGAPSDASPNEDRSNDDSTNF